MGLVLTGCGDDRPEAGTLDSQNNANDSGEQEADPTPDSPENDDENDDDADSPRQYEDDEMPEASGPEADEAEDFVEQYLQEQNEATSTGDFSAIEPMITADCQVCNDSMTNTTAIYDAGGRFEGGLFTENEVEVIGVVDEVFQVRVATVISAWEQYDANDEVVNEGPAEERVYDYGAAKDDNGDWQIVLGGRTQ